MCGPPSDSYFNEVKFENQKCDFCKGIFNYMLHKIRCVRYLTNHDWYDVFLCNNCAKHYQGVYTN